MNSAKSNVRLVLVHNGSTNKSLCRTIPGPSDGGAPRPLHARARARTQYSHRCRAAGRAKQGEKAKLKRWCRMLFGDIQEGNKQADGKKPYREPAIVNEMGRDRLELRRDHPFLVQHIRAVVQGWRANADSALIIEVPPPPLPRQLHAAITT